MLIVVIAECLQLPRQVDCNPEEHAIVIFTANCADQPFDEWMLNRDVRDRLDRLDFEYAQVGEPTVKAKQRIVVGADVFRQRLTGDGVIEHPANRDPIYNCTFDAEGMRDLLCDVYTAELWIAHFISTIAAMSSEDGPFGPGLRRGGEEEKGRRYLRSTKALWNLNNVAGLRKAASFGIRRGLTKSVVSASPNRLRVVKFGARWRQRLLINS